MTTPRLNVAKRKAVPETEENLKFCIGEPRIEAFDLPSVTSMVTPALADRSHGVTTNEDFLAGTNPAQGGQRQSTTPKGQQCVPIPLMLLPQLDQSETPERPLIGFANEVAGGITLLTPVHDQMQRSETMAIDGEPSVCLDTLSSQQQPAPNTTTPRSTRAAARSRVQQKHTAGR